jgi:hypothetical protein
MKIRMLKSAPGSIDGCRTALYGAGQEYDLGATPGARELATSFVAARCAAAVSDIVEVVQLSKVAGATVDAPRAAPVRKSARITK